MQKNKVVTFGEIMVRLGAPDYLKLIQSNSLDVSYAGAEANVAVSLSHYGISTDYITCLPENPIAEHCIMELRGHCVGVDHIQRSGREWVFSIWRQVATCAHPRCFMIANILR